MAKLNFKIYGQTIVPSVPSVVVSDTIAYIDASVEFSDRSKADWNGLSLWLHFKKGETVYDFLLTNGTCTGINLADGTYEVYAHASSNSKRITTNSCTLRVEKSGVLNGSPLPVITPTASEQISALATEAKTIAQSVRDDADAGKFDGAKGDKGDKGDRGSDGYTPIKGVDYFDGKDGKDGKDGYTPIKGVDYFDGAKGDKGDKGDTYTITEADYTAIGAIVEAGYEPQLTRINGDLSQRINKKVAKESRNIFDPDGEYPKDVGKQPSYWGGSGMVYSNNASFTTYYFPINNYDVGTKFTLYPKETSNNRTISVSMATSAKKQADNATLRYTVASNSSYTVTKTANASYILVATSSTNPEITMIEVGDTKNGYEEYYDTVYEAVLFGGLDTEKSNEYFAKTDELEKKLDSIKTIVAWGDSLTMGAGATLTPTYNVKSYPYLLSQILGSDYKIWNCGIGGENVPTIMGRQGAFPYLVQPFTIPTSGSAEITLKSSFNNGVNNVAPLLQDGHSEINPCYIDGIKGNITLTDSKYYFTREEDGDAKEISRPTAIITNAMINWKDSVQLIWVGTNGGYGTQEKLTACINAMKEYTNLVIPKYIVLGLTNKSNTEYEELDEMCEKSFARHFINIRKYLIEYGLQDANLTPTTADTNAINAGKIPPSLLYDTVHFNDYGYPIIANQVYIRGKELGYWE